MVSEVKHLRILIASPSDVANERDSVRRVVTELNRTLPGAVGVQLDIIAWETHSTPALGSDAQAILNEQLGQEYEIFIGLLWSRIGTATPRAASGTVEEFERAYARWKSSPDSVSVMFYFKEAGISPFDVDPDQVRAVQRFRATLQETALTANFKTSDELEAHLRVHLTRKVFAYANSARPFRPLSVTHQRDEAQVVSAPDDDEDEEGLLDLVEKSNVGFRTMNASIGRLSEETQAVGSFMGDQAARITALDMSRPADAKRAKQFVNRTAERLLAFGRRVDRELPQLHDSAIDAIGSIGKAAQLAPDFGAGAAQHLIENLAALQQLRSTLSNSRAQLSSWRQQVERMPRVTTRFNRAKRATVSTLDRLDRELATVESLGNEAGRMIEQILEKFRAT